MASNHRLKVGIDFGTTYSGVAWAHTGNPKEVSVIREWPGGSGASDKVPSEISYKDTGEIDKWGFEIKPNAQRLVWFKLLLDPSKYSSTQRESATSARAKDAIPRPKKPVDVVADYFTCLRRHTIKILERTYSKAFIDVTPIDYCLTVPAIWTDGAKALTLQAAETAGFGVKNKIQFISEPEAAASWSLMKDIQPNNIKVDDTFVVVDCGGGTVDLISYKVIGIDPSLSVKECAVGSGALCGSTVLNQRFENLVKSRVGQRYDRMKEISRNIMLKNFEQFLKRRFSDDEDDDIFSCPIPGVPDDADAGVEDGCFVLTREEMKSIFDPVINQIIDLVRNQVREAEKKAENKLTISAVLLVGGFGSSQYLRQRLEAHFKTIRKTDSPLEILQPINAWSSIARGAVLRGLNVLSRKARRHYGLCIFRPFEFGVDPYANLTRDPITGEHMCDDVMEYYVKLGDHVSVNDPITFNFYRSVQLDDNMKFTETIWECEEIAAPTYFADDILKRVVKFRSDLSMVPKSSFVKKQNVKGDCVKVGEKEYGSGKAKYLYD